MEKPQNRSLKDKQRLERENLILQMAEDILLEKGYRDTSMDEVAARVGIAKGTLYLHFTKKEDLMFILFEREMQKILQLFEQDFPIGTSAQHKLEALVRAMHRDPSGRRTNLMYILFNSEDFKITLKERAEGILNRVLNKVASFLDEGKSNGEFDTSIPTSIMLNSFFSVLSPSAYRRILALNQYSPDEVMLYAQRIYFRGISDRSASL